MTEKVFRYVLNDRVGQWEDIGWKAHPALEGTHHGAYSTLMEWTGEGNPREPRPECLKDRCYSPIACGGFGYCREHNFL